MHFSVYYHTTCHCALGLARLDVHGVLGGLPHYSSRSGGKNAVFSESTADSPPITFARWTVRPRYCCCLDVLPLYGVLARAVLLCSGYGRPTRISAAGTGSLFAYLSHRGRYSPANGARACCGRMDGGLGRIVAATHAGARLWRCTGASLHYEHHLAGHYEKPLWI
jgi:hypothetical protein